MGATKTLNVKNVDLGSEIMKITSGNGIERICEASGHAPTLNASFKWLRKGGKMGIVGLPKDTVKFDNPLTGKLTGSEPEDEILHHCSVLWLDTTLNTTLNFAQSCSIEDQIFRDGHCLPG